MNYKTILPSKILRKKQKIMKNLKSLSELKMIKIKKEILRVKKMIIRK
jgi:hypothetical protein